LNRPAGSGRSRRDTAQSVDDILDESLAATQRFFDARYQRRTAYCARCKRVQPVTKIRTTYGERDRVRCDGCGRTWPG
jgi:transposase-like protein